MQYNRMRSMVVMIVIVEIMPIIPAECSGGLRFAAVLPCFLDAIPEPTQDRAGSPSSVLGRGVSHEGESNESRENESHVHGGTSFQQS